jgi:hypothetical protein
MAGVIPTSEGDRRVYVSSNRRWLLAGGLIALAVGGGSVVLERDPSTGLVPAPNDYLWTVVPLAIMMVVLAWRATKVKVTTDPGGVEVVRVVGRERVAWKRLRRFEVHPTPGKQGSVVLARTDDEVLVRIWTEIMVRPVRDRTAARRLAKAKADQFAAVLEEDCKARQTALAAVGPTPQPVTQGSADGPLAGQGG